MGMGQWASAFAEDALGISKTLGDILGPCIFASMLTISRIVYSKISGRINAVKYLLCCALMTVVLYASAALIPNSIVAILACGMCGFTAGVMWPATLSLASAHYPTGGVAMFGMFALGGDIGCTLGPTAIGMISSVAGDNLRVGLLAACVFPIMMSMGLMMLMKRMKEQKK